jgi:GNAT superfamily N-acetyltransferase
MTGAAHSSPGVRLPSAEAADTGGLVRLINEAFAVEKIVIEGDRIDFAKAGALFETGNFLLLYEAEQLLGCVYVEVKNKRGYLGLLAVQPGRQKSGFGRRLATAAEDFLREAGCEAVDLRIVSARTELPPIYEREWARWQLQPRLSGIRFGSKCRANSLCGPNACEIGMVAGLTKGARLRRRPLQRMETEARSTFRHRKQAV